MSNNSSNSTQALAPAEARIRSSSLKLRSLGSHPSIRTQQEGIHQSHILSGDSQAFDSFADLVQVSTPDLAFQFRPFSQDIIYALQESLRRACGQNCDIRYFEDNDIASVGIWSRAPSSNESPSLRDQGLSSLALLENDEHFGFFLNSSFIHRSFEEQWKRKPKRLNSDGNPDTDGSIYLTGYSIEFQEPDQVILKVYGRDEWYWPDVEFKATSTETVSVAHGQIQSEVDEDLDIDQELLGIWTAITAIIFPYLFVVFGSELIFSAFEEASGSNGVSTSRVAGMVPQEIMIPGGLNIVAHYSRVAVSSGGIFAGGSYSVSPREPDVSIVGTSKVNIVKVGTNTSLTYGINTQDLLPPLQVRWSSESDIHFVNAHARTTRAYFQVIGQPGQTVSRNLSVQVTDSDGLVANNDLSVQIRLQPSGGYIP